MIRLTANQAVVIVSVESFVLALVAVLSDLFPEKRKKLKEMVVTIMMVVIVSFIVTIWGVAKYIVPDGERIESREELLSKGNKLIDMHEYLSAVEIYEKESLSTDPVALNNLAYLYERGLGVSRDLEKSSVLYGKAKNLGNKTAQKNWIIFNLQNPMTYSQIVDVLEFGYKIEDEDTVRWISWLIGVDPNSTEMSKEEIWNEFYSMGSLMQRNLINRFTYEVYIPWEYYDGFGGQFVTVKTVDNYKKIFTGAFEVKKFGEETITTPIITTVCGHYIIKKKLSFVDDDETMLIIFDDKNLK